MAALPISTTSLAVCRWAWCKEMFDTQDELVEHVLDEHVAKAVPVKKKDLPLQRRARDGASFEDSISTTYLFNDTLFFNNEDNKDNVRRSMPRLAAPEIRLSTPTPSRIPGTPPRRGITSPSPQVNRFKGLSEASSPARSPDPAAMQIDQSPSTAELIANILNSANQNRSTLSPPRTPSAGPSKRANNSLHVSPGEKHVKSPRQRLPIMRTGGKPPSVQKTTRRVREAPIQTPLTRVLGASADTGRVVVKREEENREIGLGLQIGGSNEQPNLSQTQSQLSQSGVIEGIESYVASQSQGQPISQAPKSNQELPAGQHRSQTPPPSSALPDHGHRLRTGTLVLSPALSQPNPETVQSGPSTSSQALHNGDQDMLPTTHPDAGLSPKFRVPQAPADIYVPEEDMLHSSLPSIPAFTQAPEGLDSQWPLQSQAPYGFDSQLDLDSQSQSQWLSHEPLSSRLGGS